jgi:hypothetical protein
LKTVNPALAQKYTWNRPRALSPTVPVGTFVGVKKVLADSNYFLSAYDRHLFTTVKPILAKKWVIFVPRAGFFLCLQI